MWRIVLLRSGVFLSVMNVDVSLGEEKWIVPPSDLQENLFNSVSFCPFLLGTSQQFVVV